MQFLGNKALLQLEKTAFLCSRMCPAFVVLKSYDWAKEQRIQGNCIVCGNHSQIEKDVFEILLKGSQAIILVLARSMKTRWDPEIEKAISENRILVISPFQEEVKRVTKSTAATRNRKIIEISDHIVIGHKTRDGQLAGLLKGIEHETL